MLLRTSRSSTRSWLCRLLFLLMAFMGPVTARREDDGPLAFVRGKFEALDNRGKFIAGAAAGFVGSRIVVGSAMTVIKVGAAAYLTAEIMDQMGFMPDYDITDNVFSVSKIKDVCLSKADGFRKTVRKTVNPGNIQSFIDNERMASLGLASGALVGLVL